MKKLLVIVSLLIMTTGLFAQTTMYQSISDHYRVYSDISEEYSTEVADKMEACLGLFNSIFHFDLTKLQVKLKVLIYSDKTGFDAYLQKLLGESRNDFVYIHYSDLSKSELVGFQKEDATAFDTLLLHQGLIQFLKAFIPGAPMWLSEGVSAYLETSSYDKENKKFILAKNMNWLETLKGIIKGESSETLMPITELLTIDKTTAVTKINSFYPGAWGLVHFLLNSEDRNHTRLFWDSLSIMDPSLTMQENSLLIKNYVFSWVKTDEMETLYKNYILAQKTFQDYIQEGIQYYTDNNLATAKTSFEAAINLRPSDYFAYYYLGLIEYAGKQYYKAEEHYKKALELGAEAALTNYALGVNAYADNKFESATTYLKAARDIDSEKYWDKGQEILDRIDAENAFVDTTTATVDTPADTTADTSADTTVDTSADTTDEK